MRLALQGFDGKVRGVIIMVAGLLGAGCAPLYPPLGATLDAYARQEIVPTALISDDAQLSACGTGMGLTQLVGSFERVSSRPNYVLFYTDLLTGFCAEAEAYQANLRYLRASHSGRITEAQDELIVEQRWHALASRRRYKAYIDMANVYGEYKADECPSLWWSDDEAAYLNGLVTTLQAVRSDLLSGGQVGVSRDLAAKAMRASECLDNEKWWGVPQAIRATVWSFVPGTAPSGEDMWAHYQKAAALGEGSGMSLALTLYALGAENQGRMDLVKEAVRLAADMNERQLEVPKAYVLVDEIAKDQLLYLSDQIWMTETGTRTPNGAFGTFPEDKSDKLEFSTEGLL